MQRLLGKCFAQQPGNVCGTTRRDELCARLLQKDQQRFGRGLLGPSLSSLPDCTGTQRESRGTRFLIFCQDLTCTDRRFPDIPLLRLQRCEGAPRLHILTPRRGFAATA